RSIGTQRRRSEVGRRAREEDARRRGAVGRDRVKPREGLSAAIGAWLDALEIECPAIGTDGERVGIAVRRQLSGEPGRDWTGLGWRARLREIDPAQRAPARVDATLITASLHP